MKMTYKLLYLLFIICILYYIIYYYIISTETVDYFHIIGYALPQKRRIRLAVFSV